MLRKARCLLVLCTAVLLCAQCLAIAAAQPTITSFTPGAAARCNTVTITGTNFTGATAVKFSGVDAMSYRVVNDTTITAVVPATTSGKITVRTPGGICASAAVFSFIPYPTITSFSPMAAGKGATVTVTGTNYTGVTSVKFNGVSAGFSIVNATTITAVVPITTSGKITITSRGGSCASPSVFTFVPNPTITSFTPMAAGANATVTITGTNFTGATAVKFNGVAAKSFRVVDAQTIAAVVPQTTSGKITVTTPGGICASPSVFTFVPGPTISSFTPMSAGANATVTVAGSNFTGATAVKINGVAAKSFRVLSATSISAVVPQTASGKITVTTPGGACASPSVFTFISGPSISSFAPMAVGVGTNVTITGSNLTGATAVKFNGVAAQSFTVVNATTVTAVVPQTTSGKVTVTTPGGICASPSAFTFVPSPTITAFSPTSAAIGDPVSITGTGFTGTTSVKFNGVAATAFTVVSATSIAAVVPNTTSGAIAVTTAGGTATSASSFTVIANTADSFVALGKAKVNQCVTMEPYDATSAKTLIQQAKGYFEQAKALQTNSAPANFGLAITDAALTAQTLIDKYQSTFGANSAALSTLKYTVSALQVLNLGSVVQPGKEPMNGLVTCYADSVKEPLTRGENPDPQLILNIQTDVKNTVRPMLGRVADDLTVVEANGGASFNFPVGTTDWDGYKKIDMGDVYLFHGLLLAAKWALAIPASYNANVGTFDWDTSPFTLDANHDGLLNASEYLPASPFLNLTDYSTMTAAKNDMVTAADKILAGLNATLAETSDDYDLIAWHTADAGPTQADLLKAKDYATSLKASMSAATTISWEGDNGGTHSARVFLGAWNMTPPTSLKPMMPTQEVTRWYDYDAQTFKYDTDDAEGGFPDATFGGMFPDGMPGINDPIDPIDFNTGFTGTLVGISTTPANGATNVSPWDWSGSIGFNGYPPSHFSVTLQRYFAGKWRGEMMSYGNNMGSMFFVYPDHMLWPNSSYRMIIKDEVANQTYTTSFSTGADILPN